MQEDRTSTRAPPPGFQGDMVWKCGRPGCSETIEFFGEEADVIGFLIVHHLVQKHGFSKADVIAYDKLLRDAAAEYGGFRHDDC